MLSYSFITVDGLDGFLIPMENGKKVSSIIIYYRCIEKEPTSAVVLVASSWHRSIYLLISFMSEIQRILVGPVCVLTTGNVKVAGLLIEWEQCQMHWARAGQRHPDTVQDISIWVNPDIQVGLKDIVETADLLIPEEGIRHPHLAWICHGQVFDFACGRREIEKLWGLAS